MSTRRIRLAERMAAMAGFREDNERQALALANEHARQAAEEERRRAAALIAIDLARMHALENSGDLARYALLSQMSWAADHDHHRASSARVDADLKAEQGAQTWAAARSRHEALDDRAEEMNTAYRLDLQTREVADAMDRWLARRP
ncbi:hypothetical protein [Pinirhizobacter sp.]|jgi:hypothetical protein|uniref:hypothetical protein n=1 Tax=Pinirhizobacter sp. TaxID=2950432 RepID=UPI002F412286